MKTNLSSRLFTMITLTLLIVISCAKESDTPISTPNPALEMKAGYIVDYGLVNDNTRLMFTSLSSINQTLTGAINGNNVYVSLVEASIYTNEDGFIPIGNYTFTSDEIKSPFTFTGSVSGDFYNDGYPTPIQISNGNINVLLDRDKYTFTFSFELASGIAIDGSFSDRVSYSDLYK